MLSIFSVFLPIRPVPTVRATDPWMKAATGTDLGGVIHFPSKLGSSDWPQAEAALDRLKLTLGTNAYVRWDGLWHEANWNPSAPYGYARNRRIVGLIGQRGLRSLMTLIPHPWPGSEWDTRSAANRDWGAPKPEWFARIAGRYRDAVTDYRTALQENRMPESQSAVQFGNEPASGHPGGDGTLPRGTWSGHALWKELNRDPSFYGNLQVVAPALSMLDEPSANVELATSVIPKESDWTARIDRRAMHFRFYRPDLTTPDAYAAAYVAELQRRSALVLAQPWPHGSQTREATRRDGLWITEGYVASGDAPTPWTDSWRAMLKRVRAGVPGVRVFFAYRFHPAGGPGELDWKIPVAAQRPLGSP